MNIGPVGITDVGAKREEFVELALLDLKQRQKPLVIAPVTKSASEVSETVHIEEIVHARRNSNLDRQGIDFLVKCSNGHDIPLQVKSSLRAKKKFEERCRKRDSFIPVVMVFENDSVETILHRVVECIKLVFTMIKRRLDACRHTNNQKAERRKPAHRRRRFCFRFNSPAMAH